MGTRFAGVSTMGARIAVLSLLALAPAEPARAACPSSCTRTLRACRTSCAVEHGADRRGCRRRCADASTCSAPGVRGRTGAYVVVQCRNDAAGFSLRERLEVRRGNCDPVTVMSLPAVGPVPDPAQACRLYGGYRVSFGSVIFGRFQRIGVTPDAKGVVVEVTNDHAIRGLEGLAPEPPEEGIFFVSADGTQSRRIGPPSARKIIDIVPNGLGLVGAPVFAVSPNGRYVAYEDRGPDAEGRDADQVVVIDLTTDERRQLTHLPHASGQPGTGNVGFLDDRTIVFQNGAAGLFTVSVDGGELTPIRSLRSIAGGSILLEFALAGPGGKAVRGRVLGRTPKVDYGDPPVREIFLVDGDRALQLTRFDYSDTGGVVRPPVEHDRVVFIASADPVGDNPNGVCQLFSADTLGAQVHQLTHFPDDGREKHGCRARGPGYSCDVNGVAIDPITPGVVFASSCDPLGRNPDGEQFFGMRLDGTGLRQVTSFRGVEPLEDGGVQVEMPGPAAYASVIR